MANTFSRPQRLLDNAEFRQVLDHARCYKTKYFQFYCCNNTKTQARLGVSVAKRKIKLAVARNRLKRLVRESFRVQPLTQRAKDIVVIVREQADKATPQQLWQELAQLWQQLQ